MTFRPFGSVNCVYLTSSFGAGAALSCGAAAEGSISPSTTNAARFIPRLRHKAAGNTKTQRHKDQTVTLPSRHDRVKLRDAEAQRMLHARAEARQAGSDSTAAAREAGRPNDRDDPRENESLRTPVRLVFTRIVSIVRAASQRAVESAISVSLCFMTSAGLVPRDQLSRHSRDKT